MTQSTTTFQFPKGVGARQGLKSPIGAASFPKLIEPDAKFDPPSFSVGLIYEPNDPAFKAFEAEVMKAYDEAVEYYKANAPKARDAKGNIKPPLVSDPPIGVHLDRDKNPTGNMLARFKARAIYKDHKTGKTVPKTLPLYDGKARPWPKGVRFDGGSRLRAYYDIVPFVSVTGVGVSLRLTAVVVVEAKTWGPKIEAEDDYVPPDTDAAVVASETGSDDAGGSTPPAAAGSF